MSNTNGLNAPEHCLEAMAKCVQGLATYSHGPKGVRKLTQDAMHYHAGALTGLQKLRAERDRYRAALEEIERRWTLSVRSIAKEALEK